MDDGLLIEQVEKFKHIYDKKSSLFKSKLARENAWKSIGKILGVEAEQCENRWNVLRNKYSSIKRKVETTPSGSQAFSISWPYFESMKFLDPFTLTRARRVSSLQAENSQGSSYSSQLQSDQWPGLTDIITTESAPEDLDLSQTFECIDEDVENISPSSPAPNMQSKRKRSEEQRPWKRKNPGQSDVVSDSVSVAFKSISDTLGTYVAAKTQTSGVDPADKLFAESIACDLTKVKQLTDKMQLKQEIYILLRNYFQSIEENE